jgi:hypothetical protein
MSLLQNDDEEPEPLVVKVEFLAKPWPQPGDIRWYSDPGPGVMRLPLEELQEGIDYQLGPLEPVGAGQQNYELATSLIIRNLTTNIRHLWLNSFVTMKYKINLPT